MKTINKKAPFFKAMKANRKALKLVFKENPQSIISRFLLSVWNALTPYVVIYLSALVIDELCGAKDPERLKFLALTAITVTAIISLLGALITKWRNSYNASFWYAVQNITRKKILSMDQVDREDIKTTDLISFIEQNVNSQGWGIYRVIQNYQSLLTSVFGILGGVTLTVSLFATKVPESGGKYLILNNPLIAIGVIAAMLAVTLIAPLFNNKANSYWSANMNKHNLANRMFSFYGFLGTYPEVAEDIRSYRQDLICDKYNKNKEDVFGSKGYFSKLAKGPIGALEATASAFSVLFTGIVYAFVCLKALGGAFGLGSITQYISSITKVSTGVSDLVRTLGSMRTNATFLDSVFELLNMPSSMYTGNEKIEKLNADEYEIEFKNVSFKYPGSENFALRNVNFKFKAGKRLAVVGRNGSGKTTFIKLLCRLYDPTEGRILLNGKDIKQLDYDEYISLFSVVFQDFKLLAFKLGENVAGSKDYDKDLVLDCLDKAGFSENLKKMGGLDTYLYKDFNEDGVTVSGGEAQKIAIARALYKNAPFIVLDEPTAALDPIAEAEIYEKFDGIAGDKTSVYISHRLSSCKFCDEIAVFDEGSLIQLGRHEDLLTDEDGKYYELWQAQAKYYVDEESKDGEKTPTEF